MIASLMLAPAASASGPDGVKVGPAHPATTLQSATWLAAKNNYLVISGIKPNQGKHGKANPTVIATSLINLSTQVNFLAVHPNSYPPVSGEPSADTLYNGYGVEYIAEPGDGLNWNLPNGTQKTDDGGHGYTDGWYFTLCGPGAADAAMYYWPAPANDSTHTVSDQLPGNYTDSGTHTTNALTWYGEDGSAGTDAFRLRGYMTWLAFGLNNVPSWQTHKIYNYNNQQVQVSGMLPETDYETGGAGGATLQSAQAAMNWEASGENSSDWLNYFYAVTWNNSVSNIGVTLHNDIVTDIASSNVPVVVEVDASDLPNWPSGSLIKHFITIVGYDDSWNGVGGYAYFDTCKSYTNCDGGGSSTPDLHWISQSQLTSAVSAIQTDQNSGDGGWIW